MAAGRADRARHGANALSRSVRFARPSRPCCGRSGRRIIHVRKGRAEDRRRRRLRRCVEEGLLRLGIQEEETQSRRRARASSCATRRRWKTRRSRSPATPTAFSFARLGPTRFRKPTSSRSTNSPSRRISTFSTRYFSIRKNCGRSKPAPASPRRPPTNSQRLRFACRAAARRKKSRISSTNSCSAFLPTA